MQVIATADEFTVNDCCWNFSERHLLAAVENRVPLGCLWWDKNTDYTPSRIVSG